MGTNSFATTKSKIIDWIWLGKINIDESYLIYQSFPNQNFVLYGSYCIVQYRSPFSYTNTTL